MRNATHPCRRACGRLHDRCRSVEHRRLLPFQRALADDRSVSRRPRAGGDGRSRAARPLLLRCGRRRRVGEFRHRADVEADFRRRRYRLDRLHRRCAELAERHLRRQRRSGYALGHRLRQRHVRLERRGENVDARRPRGFAPNRRGGRRSDQCEDRVRGGARTSIRAERTARRFQDRRRRCDVEQSPVQRCEYRRGLARDGSAESERPLCGAMANAPAAVERLSPLKWTGQRAVQNDRRRQDVGATYERASRARRTHRHCGSAVESAARLRQRRQRSESRRRVPLRRRGRDVDAHRRRRTHLDARLVFQRHQRRSQETRRRLRDGYGDVPFRRRRQKFRRDPRRARRRRLSYVVDRSGRRPAHDSRQRPRRRRNRERRANVEHVVQPADGAVLSRRDRRRLSVRRLRRTAGFRRRRRTERHEVRDDFAARLSPDRRRRRIGFDRSRSAAPGPRLRRHGRPKRISRPAGNRTSIPRSTIRTTLWRGTWTLPIAISPVDKTSIYFGRQNVFRSRNGGKTWQIVSPDLSRANEGTPSNLDPSTLADNNGLSRHGVVYAIAPSPLSAGLVWAGTDDGNVWVTRDSAKTWSNVTPPALTAWSKVGIIEASHFDAGGAYLAVDRHRLEDYRPYIYRTHDGGKTWTPIASGIPDGSFVNAVREDPQIRGLLVRGNGTRRLRFVQRREYLGIAAVEPPGYVRTRYRHPRRTI